MNMYQSLKVKNAILTTIPQGVKTSKSQFLFLLPIHCKFYWGQDEEVAVISNIPYHNTSKKSHHSINKQTIKNTIFVSPKGPFSTVGHQQNKKTIASQSRMCGITYRSMSEELQVHEWLKWSWTTLMTQPIFCSPYSTPNIDKWL